MQGIIINKDETYRGEKVRGERHGKDKLRKAKDRPQIVSWRKM